MSTNRRPDWTIATGQRGYITRRQLNAGGISDAMLRSRIQSGFLQQTGVRTFTTPMVNHSALDELTALMIDVGDPVWTYGPTSGALLGFDGFVLKPPFHLLTERNRNVRRVGHVIHTTEHLEQIDRATAHGLDVTSATRTLIDLARRASPEVLTRALDSAIRDLLTTENFLHRRIAELRAQGRHGLPRLLEVIEGAEITRGGQSFLERRFLELVDAVGLPHPQTQAVLSKRGDRLIRVDCWFDVAQLAVELLGYRWHRTELQMSNDAARANRLMLQGTRMLQFSYSQVAGDPKPMLRQLAAALDIPLPSLDTTTFA